MTFLAPIAGLIGGALGGAVVLLAWMLKLRRRPVRVSSTMLWARTVRDMEGNVPWQMARPSVLLLLHLLIVALLALAIARPVTGGGVGVRPGTVIILDAGGSMRAVVDAEGRTRLDLAKERAIGLIRRAGSEGGASVRVIRAGASASLVSGGGGSWREAAARVRRVEGDDAPGDLDAAIALARSGGGEEAASPAIVVLTAREPNPESGADVFFEGVDPAAAERGSHAIENIGITRLGARRDDGDPALCRFFARLEGRVDGPTGVVVRVVVDGETIASRAAELTAEEDAVSVTLTARIDRAALVRLELSGDDALGSDDRAWVTLPDPSPIRVRVVAPGGSADRLVLDALESATGGPVSVVAPGDAPAGAAPDLVVGDRVVLGEGAPGLVPPGVPTLVLAGAGGAGDGSTTRARTWERSHPLMLGVDLSRVAFTGAAALDEAGAAVVARWARGALIVERARGGARHIRVGFALPDSNWGVLVSLPIFVANAVERLVPGTRGVGRTHRVGEPVPIDAPVEGVSLVSAPDPSARLVGTGNGRAELLGAARAGVYGIRGIGTGAVGVSVLDGGVTRRAGVRRPAEDASARAGGGVVAGSDRVALWRWFALAAMIVLALEWTLDAWRRRV